MICPCRLQDLSGFKITADAALGSVVGMHAAAWFNNKKPKDEAEKAQSDNRDTNVVNHAVKNYIDGSDCH